MGSPLWLRCRVNFANWATTCRSRILAVRALTGQGGRGHPTHQSTEEAPLPAMSLERLPTGCCASYPRWHRCFGAETDKIGASEGYGEGGARIQLRGLDTEQLKGSLVVLYAPAGNSCLLRLVGHVWMNGYVVESRVWPRVVVTDMLSKSAQHGAVKKYFGF